MSVFKQHISRNYHMENLAFVRDGNLFIAVPTLASFEVFAVQHPLVRSRLGFINVLIKSSPFTVFLSRIDLLQSFFNEILLVVTKRI